MEKCVLGKDVIYLPEELLEKSRLFIEVVSLDTWKNVLSDSQRIYLQKFLPSFPNDEAEKLNTVEKLFSGEDFKFYNPLKRIAKRLKDGYYSPSIAHYSKIVRRAKHREYKVRQQRYYMELLKSIILERQKILAEVRYLAPDQLPSFAKCKEDKASLLLEKRANASYRRVMKNVRIECGEDTSSDEDASPAIVPKVKSEGKSCRNVVEPVFLQTLNFEKEGETDANLLLANQNGAVLPRDLNESDLLEMLKRHKSRKHKRCNSPDLNTFDVNLDDVISRYNLTPVKKASVSLSKRRIQDKESGIEQIKKAKLDENLEESSDIGSDFDVESNIISAVQSNSFSSSHMISSTRQLSPKMKPVNFFCLLRDVLKSHLNSRATLFKVEGVISDWQLSQRTDQYPWINELPWVENVWSALRFLAGHSHVLDIEDFVPFIEFKEKSQEWQWVADGRDGTEDIQPFFSLWLQSRKKELKSGEETSSTGQPKMWTDYIVRPTTGDEKLLFQEQESQRFAAPHHGFTYEQHGYTSVVGPVKGVYDNEGVNSKAREHALLVNDRPPYVTILNLVRDAVARLPNGEGTRADICELLKDSKYLAHSVTDGQLNAVVSGALDRLHYEKDPCVKYDVNSKLWIYLHRDRTENDFERIHQAQGAAVKAKKTLQKPRPFKRMKEANGALPSSVSSGYISPMAPLTLSMVANEKAPTTSTRTYVQSSIAGNKATGIKTPQGTTVRQALSMLQQARAATTHTATAIFDTSSQSAILATISTSSHFTAFSRSQDTVSPHITDTAISTDLPNVSRLLTNATKKVLTKPNNPPHISMVSVETTKPNPLNSAAVFISGAPAVVSASSNCVFITVAKTVSSGTGQAPLIAHFLQPVGQSQMGKASTVSSTALSGVKLPGKTIQIGGKPLNVDKGVFQLHPNSLLATQVGLVQVDSSAFLPGLQGQKSISVSSSQATVMASVVSQVISKGALNTSVVSSPKSSKPTIIAAHLPSGKIALQQGVKSMAGCKINSSLVPSQFVLQQYPDSGVGSSQNIQFVKRVLTPSGSGSQKQTAFLITPQTTTKTTTAQVSCSPQTMFARIIVPPSGLRLAGLPVSIQGQSPGFSFVQAVPTSSTSMNVSTTTATTSVNK